MSSRGWLRGLVGVACRLAARSLVLDEARRTADLPLAERTWSAAVDAVAASVRVTAPSVEIGARERHARDAGVRQATFVGIAVPALAERLYGHVFKPSGDERGHGLRDYWNAGTCQFGRQNLINASR